MKDSLTILAGAALAALLIIKLMEKVIVPWLAKKWSREALRKIESGEITPRHFPITIVWNSKGVSFQKGATEEKSSVVTWENIVKATAFKRDLFTTDCICLCFETVDTEAIEINEEMNHWSDFIEVLPTFLPSCIPSHTWLWSVASPAFAPNVTEIYSRTPTPTSPESAC